MMTGTYNTLRIAGYLFLTGISAGCVTAQERTPMTIRYDVDGDKTKDIVTRNEDGTFSWKKVNKLPTHLEKAVIDAMEKKEKDHARILSVPFP